LGNWGDSNIIQLNSSNFPKWNIKIDRKVVSDFVEYKYVIVDKKTENIVAWETGDNRLLHLDKNKDTEHIRVDDNFFRFDEGYNLKRAGVSLPVFSIRTNKSFGVGEFLDIKKIVDWASVVELSMIQILPVNDTISTNTFLDSYPYNAISVFALHPLYINIFKVGKLKDNKIFLEYKKTQKQLNANKYVDYPKVISYKLRYLRLLFKEQSSELFKSEEYIKFFDENREWLQPYALFSYLRDKTGEADFEYWDKYKKYNSKATQELLQNNELLQSDISFWYFVQYHLNKQLSEAYNYAKKHKVVLKGDIPIGISRCSVDAWVAPDLYNFDGQAGAPPDAFSANGQNWGFPTYNWSKMKEDNYLWWRKRLEYMSNFFDAYRIDHILGFFRIWEMPIDAIQGVLGHFNPDLPLSVDELENIDFDEKRMCNPYITQAVVDDVFGEYAEFVIEKYLKNIGKSTFELKRDYATQKQIYNSFIKQSSVEDLSEKDKKIFNGLMYLVTEVLFIPVKNRRNYYYPRILMQDTHSFNNLNDDVKEKINKIYNNYFYFRHEEFWKQEALQKLPALIDATNMLICGEDLGMVPSTVSEVMSQLGILSLEIQRMPKEYGVRFSNLEYTPYSSVLTTSTHDMSTIREWWEESREDVEEFYRYFLKNSGEIPQKAEPWICKQIVTQHLDTPAMWTVFPIQDLLSMNEDIELGDAKDERINDPSNSQNYWRYRMPISFEELQSLEGFNATIKQMILKSERGNKD
jgi:4-alpha-glucanotransferase